MVPNIWKVMGIVVSVVAESEPLFGDYGPLLIIRRRYPCSSCVCNMVAE